MSKNSVLIIPNYQVPPTPGAYFRLLCMSGKNKGLSYFLKSERIILGRGPNCDIQVYDVKSSREHAELKRLGPTFILTDLSSQNGTIVNDHRVSQQTLADNDLIVIGQTVYKYSKISVEKKNTDSPKTDINFNDDSDTDTEVKEKKTGGFFLIIIIIGGAILLFDQGENQIQRRRVVKNKIDTNFANEVRKQDIAESKKVEEKIQEIFHRGHREVREGNYYRAINEYKLATLLAPTDSRAKFYLDQTMDKLNNEVANSLNDGKRYVEAGKYENAMMSYCHVVRLLQQTPEHKGIERAKDRLKELKEKMNLANALDCLNENSQSEVENEQSI